MFSNINKMISHSFAISLCYGWSDQRKRRIHENYNYQITAFRAMNIQWTDQEVKQTQKKI